MPGRSYRTERHALLDQLCHINDELGLQGRAGSTKVPAGRPSSRLHKALLTNLHLVGQALSQQQRALITLLICTTAYFGIMGERLHRC